MATDVTSLRTRSPCVIYAAAGTTTMAMEVEFVTKVCQGQGRLRPQLDVQGGSWQDRQYVAWHYIKGTLAMLATLRQRMRFDN